MLKESRQNKPDSRYTHTLSNISVCVCVCVLHCKRVCQGMCTCMFLSLLMLVFSPVYTCSICTCMDIGIKTMQCEVR